MQQLLWIETLVKLAPGLALLLAPGWTARALGLPRDPTGFWPRLLGGTLVGLAAGFVLEGWIGNVHGIGLAGALAVNLAAAGTIAGLLILGKAAPSRRGRILLWLAVALLVLLALLELPYA